LWQLTDRAEIRSHRNRHQKAALSWLHLYLSKVTDKEEAEKTVPQVTMEYQASGFELTPETAGALVNLAVRTKSDVALVVLCNAAKYRIWPTANTFGRLLKHYGALHDVEAMRIVWRTMRDKGVVPDTHMLQYYFRGFAGAEQLGDTKRSLWPVALPALQAGQVDPTGANLLLKVCLRDAAAPREQVLELVAKVPPNASTAKLVEELKTTPPPVVEAAAAAAGAQKATAAKQ
jgi:hypothetical protein